MRNDSIKVQLRIGGKLCAASTGAEFERIGPATGKPCSVAAAASMADAARAADEASRAFSTFTESAPNKRRSLLNGAAEQLERLGDDLVTAMCEETGATEGWARFNVALAADIFREAAAMTTQIGGEVIPSNKPGSLAMTMRQPAGVVLGIAPWNAPIILGVRAVALPLACGNSVILKGSEVCPRTHSLICQALEEAGFPAGTVNFLTNAPADAEGLVSALIAHPAVRRINFTGSTRVGRTIAKLAAEQLKPVLLELGGKAPLIVLQDADLEEAAKAANFGSFMNQGQICMSTERVVVVDSVADAFLEKFVERARTLKAGTAAMSMLVDAAAGARINGLLQDALNKGGKCLVGGPAEGAHMSATIVDRVTPEMRLYGEESFGPVASIIRVKDEAEALKLANDTEYGLSAAIFTKDIARGLRMAKKIHSGICHINGSTVHDEAQMPFGGMKSSGYGRFGGKAGIAEFTDLRWITIETEPGHFPI